MQFPLVCHIYPLCSSFLYHNTRNNFYSPDLSKQEGEVEELKESLRHTKRELEAEMKRREEVEKALEEVVTENQQLEDKMMRLEHDHGQLQMEIHNVQVRSIKVWIKARAFIFVRLQNLPT